MADALIETVTSNPYESIVADTSSQMSDIDQQIQQVTNAINKLEQTSPTSPTLPQLRERLSSLQSKKESLTTTNDSAKSLMDAYNTWQQNYNTLKWIYDIKQQELQKEKDEAEKTYNRMYEDTKKANENYMNALANANASEAAIINANAWRDWASAQSTAEARARNYLNNAQAQYEAANNARQNLNTIDENRLNSRAWYTQLSQSNADNYLRQQVLSDMELAEAERNRQAQYWSSNGWGWGWSSSKWYSYSWWWGWKWNWWGWGWWSDIVDPYEEFWDQNNDTWDWYPTLSQIMAEFDKQWTSPTYAAVKARNPNITEKDFLSGMFEYNNALTSEKKNVIKDSYNKWDMSLEEYWKQLVDLENQEKENKKAQKTYNQNQKNAQYYEDLYLKALKKYWPNDIHTQAYLNEYNKYKNS